MPVADAAPLSRAEINRRNAQKSTGPRSDEGKARVRFNALKHGLRARTLVLPGEDSDVLQDRLDAWTADLKPRDEVDRFLVTRAVHASWMLDRAARAVAARAEVDRFADAGRLAQQAELVEALGSRLFREPVRLGGLDPLGPPDDGPLLSRPDAEDPDDPARLVIRLEATAPGCAWLLDRWAELRQTLEDGLVWLPHDRLRAIRMLGRQPLDAVDDRRVMRICLDCWALSRRGDRFIPRLDEQEARDPEAEERLVDACLDRMMRRVGRGAFDDLLDELAPPEREEYVERLRAREPMRGWDGGPEAARAGLLELVVGEEERLEAVLAGHLEREEAEAVAAQAFDASAYGERLRKYEQSNDRALLRLVQALRKRHETAGAATPVAEWLSDDEARSPSAALRAPSPPRGEGDSSPSPLGERVGVRGSEESAAPGTTDPAGPHIPDGDSGIDPVLGPVTLGPVGDENEDNGGVPPRELPGTSADRTEPLPAEELEVASAGPAPLATFADEATATFDRDRDARPSASPIGRLAATVRRMAGAALALFAMASAAALPTASAPARSAHRPGDLPGPGIGRLALFVAAACPAWAGRPGWSASSPAGGGRRARMTLTWQRFTLPGDWKANRTTQSHRSPNSGCPGMTREAAGSHPIHAGRDPGCAGCDPGLCRIACV